MKLLNIKRLIPGAALGFVLLTTSSGWAMPPIPQTARGTIQNIDYSARTLTVTTASEAKPLVFVWKDSTRFTQRGKRICSGALEAGLRVKVHYRREVGRLVPREVSVRSDADTPCTNGKCWVNRINP